MCFSVERTIKDNGEQSVVLVDTEYRIVEEVTLFLNYMENKGAAVNTIESYCFSLKVFYEWLSKEGIQFYEVGKRDMISLIDFIKTQGNKKRERSGKTINKYLASVTSFYRYFEGIGGYIDENPLTIKGEKSGHSFYNHKIDRNKLEVNFFRQIEKKNGSTKRLFPQQIEKLYNKIDVINRSSSVIARNKLIFRLLYETGIRISELLGLRMLDYSEPNPTESIGVIYIRKHTPLYHKDHSIKTNERDIPVSMDLIFALDDYVLSERPQKGEMDTVFVNHSASSLGNFMIRRPVEKIFNQLSEASGIKCTPHMLRHTHGTELKESGYSEVYIMDRLGHTSITSTEKYMHISYEAQKKAYKNFIHQRNEELTNE